ncbi:hypothetical protein CP97_05720 [Aurantiacibacter atlanticus]|uniref:Uncharacterized protein n=1 Tax=Aurantiacibacter atlanticus TaxID=1648404 RepID=A0A0H4VEV1_9SPHN|nr:hypothetical protein CP97_05720 [Aurantiacibacter atlanticus]
MQRDARERQIFLPNWISQKCLAEFMYIARLHIIQTAWPDGGGDLLI